MSEEDRARFEIVTLRSGAAAVREVQSGEVMHPAIGPWREANALYVAQSRLAERLCREGPPLCLYDVGLGAAANLTAALACARGLGDSRRRELRVVSFERDLEPLRLALSDARSFPFLDAERHILESLLNEQRHDEEGLQIRLLLGDARLLYSQAEWPANVIFFDPFSPAANPGLWTPESFRALRDCCENDGEGSDLYTYSAATPTRVSMLLGGFFVGIGDSIGEKRETTAAATRRQLLARPLDDKWLARWARSSAREPHGGWRGEMSELEERVRGCGQFIGVK